MIITPAKRKILFYGLTILFALLSPYLISSAFGYAFNFTKWEVEQTGGVFITSKNARVSIMLDGTRLKETSILSGNALITEIPSGKHNLAITKEGYRTWQKKITVEPLTVTEIRDIILTPHDNSFSTSTTEEAQMLFSRKASNEKRESDMPPPFSLDTRGNLIQRIGTTTRLLAQNVHSFADMGEEILFVNKNGFLSRMNLKNEEVQILGRPGFYLASRPIAFRTSPSGEVLLIDESGGLFLLDSLGALSTIGGNARDILFDPSGAKALIMKEKSIELLWLKDNPYQPFQKAGTREEIIALNEVIREAAWFYFYSAHIVTRTDNRILFVDLDGRGGHYATELFSGASDEIITTSNAPKEIFYRIGDEFRTIEL